MKKKKDSLELVVNNEPVRVSASKKAEFLNQMAKEWVRQKNRASWIMGGDGPRYGVSRDGESSPIYAISKDQVLSVANEREIKAELHKKFAEASPQDINNIYALIGYELYDNPVNVREALPVGLKDDARLAWTRLPFTREEAASLKLDDLKEFDHILGLCGKGARSLVLWIGSLLDPQSSRTQYLHLKSDGGNGKSTLFEAIRLVLGENKVISADSATFQDQYFGEALEGATLLLFADENNTSFMSSSKFKRFTGESSVTVNPKFKHHRNILFTHKTVILSNNDIQITSSYADVRRLISVTMEADTEKGGHRWWYRGLRDSGEKILAYCYSEYLKELEKNPALRSFIPADEGLVQEAIKRKYEETIGAFFEHYKVTDKEEDRVRCSEVHKTLCNELGFKRNMINVSNFKEALKSIGVSIVTSDNIPKYVGLKKSTSQSISEKAKSLVQK